MVVPATDAEGSEALAAASRPKRELLGREHVEHHQRARAAAAVIELAHEFGIGEVTAVGVCRMARMSRLTYYNLFGNFAGCLRYSFAEAFRRVIEPARGAAASERDWPDRVRAAIGTLYRGIAAEPLMAELCLVHSFGALEQARGHDYEATVELVGRLLSEDGEPEAADGNSRDPAAFTVEALARMIVGLANLRIQQGETARLPEHSDEMVQLVAVNLLGEEEAEQLRSALNENDELSM